MQLIPAIDLRHGRVVRLAQGDDRRRTAYDLDPVEVLRGYGAAGVELVHVVDLDAAFGEPPQHRAVARLAAAGGPAIELGGGLKDRATVAAALDLGCRRVVIGSLVARQPERFADLARQFPGRLVPAVEVAAGEVRVAGWTESAQVTPDELADRLRGLPCPAVLVTDVDRDGTLEGPNLELSARVAERSGLPALVSGGVSRLDDLRRAATVPGVGGVIVGKALYEGRFDIAQALDACAGRETVR